MKIHNKILNESLHKYVFDNGFKLYILPKKDYAKKHVYFATEYGALYNDFVEGDTNISMPLGIAHFLEHKIFESKNESVFETFEKLGASINAYTNYFSTCYTFSTVHHFHEALKNIIALVQTLDISEASVEKEKKIILRELMMHEDQPQWLAFKNMLKGLYKEHPIQHDIGGTEASVNDISADQLKKCYESFYTPDRMILFVIGDLDPKAVVETVKNALSTEFMERPKSPQIILPKEPEQVVSHFKSIKMDVKMPVFYLGIKDRVFYQDPKKRLEKAIVSKILSELVFGKTSDFYETYYNKGLINGSFLSDYVYGRTFGYTAISAETKNPRKIKALIESEIIKKQKSGLSEAIFDSLKKKMIGRHLSSFNSTQYIANTFMNYYMKGIELFDYLETLQSIEFKQVESRFLEHYDLNYSTTSVVE
jgi:predicted Zn-dependent peptidase